MLLCPGEWNHFCARNEGLHVWSERTVVGANIWSLRCSTMDHVHVVRAAASSYPTSRPHTSVYCFPNRLEPQTSNSHPRDKSYLHELRKWCAWLPPPCPAPFHCNVSLSKRICSLYRSKYFSLGCAYSIYSLTGRYTFTKHMHSQHHLCGLYFSSTVHRINSINLYLL